jgi:hypothetical protein
VIPNSPGPGGKKERGPSKLIETKPGLSVVQGALRPFVSKKRKKKKKQSLDSSPRLLNGESRVVGTSPGRTDPLIAPIGGNAN